MSLDVKHITNKLANFVYKSHNWPGISKGEPDKDIVIKPSTLLKATKRSSIFPSTTNWNQLYSSFGSNTEINIPGILTEEYDDIVQYISINANDTIALADPLKRDLIETFTAAFLLLCPGPLYKSIFEYLTTVLLEDLDVKIETSDDLYSLSLETVNELIKQVNPGSAKARFLSPLFIKTLKAENLSLKHPVLFDTIPLPTGIFEVFNENIYLMKKFSQTYENILIHQCCAGSANARLYIEFDEGEINEMVISELLVRKYIHDLKREGNDNVKVYRYPDIKIIEIEEFEEAITDNKIVLNNVEPIIKKIKSDEVPQNNIKTIGVIAVVAFILIILIIVVATYIRKK